MRRAVATSAFVGTHPVQRQSPPSFSRSISATLRPSRAQPDAVTSPAVPPPMMTTSKFSGMRPASFHDNDLLQRVHDVDEVALSSHYCIDRLVRGWRLVDHVRVLAAFD